MNAHTKTTKRGPNTHIRKNTLIRAIAHTNKKRHTHIFREREKEQHIIHGSNESIAIPGVLKLFKAVKDTLYIFQYHFLTASRNKNNAFKAI